MHLDKLTIIEIIFLLFQRSHKPHGRIRHWGYAGFSEDDYSRVKALLMKKKVLNSRGIIDPIIKSELMERYPGLTQHHLNDLVQEYRRKHARTFSHFAYLAQCNCNIVRLRRTT